MGVTQINGNNSNENLVWNPSFLEPGNPSYREPFRLQGYLSAKGFSLEFLLNGKVLCEDLACDSIRFESICSGYEMLPSHMRVGFSEKIFMEVLFQHRHIHKDRNRLFLLM